MRIGHNMFSERIYKNYTRSLEENSHALRNISSGKRINSAKDDPSKILHSETLKMSLLSRDAASQNIQDTNSMIQTFDGAMQEMNNNISRLKELTTKAATGTSNPGDKAVIQEEIDKIKDSIDYLANNTKFNGVTLSDSSVVNSNPSTIQYKQATIGALPDEKVEIPFYNSTSAGLGLSGLDVTTATDFGPLLDSVDKAGVTISSIRSVYGALQSRLEGSLDDMSGMNQSLTSAESSIEDADIAEESLQYSRTQVLYQASIALMAQSNKFPQDALNVLSSVR